MPANSQRRMQLFETFWARLKISAVRNFLRLYPNGKKRPTATVLESVDYRRGLQFTYSMYHVSYM
jgi:hypothetical protein